MESERRADAERAARVQKQLTIGMAVFMVVAVLLAVYARDQRNKAVVEARDAEAKASRYEAQNWWSVIEFDSGRLTPDANDALCFWHANPMG